MTLYKVFLVREDSIHSRKVERDGSHCREEERSLGEIDIIGESPSPGIKRCLGETMIYDIATDIRTNALFATYQCCNKTNTCSHYLNTLQILLALKLAYLNTQILLTVDFTTLCSSNRSITKANFSSFLI